MKLKKMLLVNWLYYEKTILSFEDIVFLSGKTGEGKSALIDAMQLVILGRTDNSIFNKSANDKTTRDLMGYLKGKYKDGTFKRDKGMFSSHLCMEFDRFLEEYIIITENRNSKIKSKTNYLLFVGTKESILFGLPTIKPNLFSK